MSSMARRVFLDLTLVGPTFVVFLCAACAQAHPEPDALDEGSEMNDPEPCDACQNPAGPYRFMDARGYSQHLLGWADRRRSLRATEARNKESSP